MSEIRLDADDRYLQTFAVDIEAALLNKDYQGTDLVKLSQFAAEFDIPQSAEELIGQLSE
ncbi:hypothetical protein [Haliscomenobacter hydrossis]|uniref:Uncharacterized protein n=1 Tax=Haliscomenobacter hydrossis (strain ATCC 27775 / DSM 1100 / LMG 10767 / O) TaxID=760192 RepID=F4L4J2_HALH1|nr:hypothetical protein [Haliscomenobacter hydrossis]AEE51993.1 hypothetical protein Halhy_4147 [Haliscomenobacter hydrossis DSM 1100]